MLVLFYAFNKRHNSTRLPTGGTGVNCCFKNRVSVYEPTLLLTGFDENWNYAKIADIYFYVEDIVKITDTQVEVRMQVDVLATWRTHILGSSAFVQLSASDYDEGLPDTRFSTKFEITENVNTAKLFSDIASYDYGSQCVVFSYASTTGVGTVWLSLDRFEQFLNSLNDTSFFTFLDDFSKQFNSAYEALISAKLMPFPFYAEFGASDIEIVLGTYHTGVIAKKISLPTRRYAVNIEIPRTFEDFRSLEPYTSLYLLLPSYGYLELNPSDLIGVESIQVTANIDYLSGVCTYMVGDIAKCECCFATELPIGYVSKNSSAILGAVTGAFNPNPIMAIGSIGMGLIASQKRSVGTTGGSPSNSSMYIGELFADFGNIKLIERVHDTNVEPNTLLATNGRLLNQVRTLSSLSGFCQCVNASVSCNAPKRYMDEINNLLDGGIFIE